MGRPPKFDRDTLLDAAVVLVARGGPTAVTAAALAEATGAPSGSIYHRFTSIEALLAELWVRTVERFQTGFVAALEHDAIEAAVHTPRWSREHLAEARVLLLHRRSELASTFPARLDALRDEGTAAMRVFVRRNFGRSSERAMETARFALIDVPYGAVRRHLVAGHAPPPLVDELVAQTARALLR